MATKGLQGFIDALLDSEEYLTNFGYNTVPYQRRRVLPGRAEGERPIHIKEPPATMLTIVIFWASLRLFGRLRSSGLSLKTRRLPKATPLCS